MWCCHTNFKHIYYFLFKNLHAEALRQKKIFKWCILKERNSLSKVVVQIGFAPEYLNEVGS